MAEKKIIELHDGETDSERATRLEVAKSRTAREGRDPDAAREPVSSSRLESDPSKSSYSNYLFGGSGTDERPAWSDTARGRLAIRLFSRGIVGAGFFVVGGHIAKKQLEGYESWKEAQNPLQHVAKFWDHTAGRAFENVTHFLTPGDAAAKARAAWEVTNFRTKTFNGISGGPTTQKDRWGFEQHLNGRSLGAEVVTVTFDFFMASIGDAMTRNIVQAFDPNVKQPWLLDEHGKATTRDKGHFDFGKWTQSLARSSWRVMSKNAGEDWAAALPYVYQMKWQRQALARMWPGFKLSSDHSWNGGMATVATQDYPEKGLTKGQIKDGYQLPGLVDLQVRFVGYNWYTLMYREMYDAIARNFDKMKTGEFHIKLPENINPISAVLDGTGFLARYVTKSFIKANLYMNPAVIPFWMFRTPQSKWRGGFAADYLAKAKDGTRDNALMTLSPHGAATGGTAADPIFLENIASDIYPRAQLIHGAPRPDKVFFGNGHGMHASEMAPGTKNMFNMAHPFEFFGVRRNLMEHFLNPFGWVCFKSGSGLTHIVDHFLPNGDFVSRMMHKAADGTALEKGALLLEREKTLRNFVDASYSYTPYMWLKAETALRVDDRRSVEELGHMDKAIYRLIDNTFGFNFKGAKQAAKDVWTLAINYEKDVKSREGEGLGHQSVGDGTVIPRTPNNAAEPITKVDTKTIAHHGTQRHEPADFERANASDGDEQHHRRWAETVAGRKLDAQFQATHPTVH